MHGKQKLYAVLMSTDESHVSNMSDPVDPGQTMTGNMSIIFFQALTKMGVPVSAMVTPTTFKSASGHSAVSAVIRVNQGWFFPLSSAICFLERPPLLINHSDIIALQPDRTGPRSTTFDILIHQTDGGILHIQQIGSGELPGIVEYCNQCSIKVHKLHISTNHQILVRSTVNKFVIAEKPRSNINPAGFFSVHLSLYNAVVDCILMLFLSAMTLRLPNWLEQC